MRDIRYIRKGGWMAGAAVSVPCGRVLNFDEFELKKSASEKYEKSRRMTCAVAEENLLQISAKKMGCHS